MECLTRAHTKRFKPTVKFWSKIYFQTLKTGALLVAQSKSNDGLQIRLIESRDNDVVADIIRLVMTEFGAVGSGYSISDTEVDDMYTAYSSKGSEFYVVELDVEILGCGGFGPLAGGDADTCELRKMYFKSALRGLGIGTELLNLCIEEASAIGFNRCYLETLDHMTQARRLYERHGFISLDHPMGNTGHTSCGTWMAREL
jgi:putative acetyltransferase